MKDADVIHQEQRKANNRARVIVHMFVSIDGKIDGEYGHPEDAELAGAYYSEELFRLSRVNANGATTAVMYAAPGHPDLSRFSGSNISYEDWVPRVQTETWDVVFDRKGRVGWETNYFDYGGKRCRAIEVVSRRASFEYLSFLRSKEIPYLVCGNDDLDLEQALVKLKSRFGIESICLCGGAIINGAFLKDDLVDSISLVVAPYVSGDNNAKSVFDTKGKFVPDAFVLEQAKKLEGGGVHLIFDRKHE